MNIKFKSNINPAVERTFSDKEIKAMSFAERHLLVSLIRTPSNFVEPDDKEIDYVKMPYMREIAQRWYGGYSFKLCHESCKIVQDPDGNHWHLVYGDLEWQENGIAYAGSMSDAHRIQFLNEKDSARRVIGKTGTYMDLGNDVKASITDLEKKALNFYLNICDDIYRWEGCMLPDEEKGRLIEYAYEAAGENEKLIEAVEKALKTLNRGNYADIKRKIDQIAGL